MNIYSNLELSRPSNIVSNVIVIPILHTNYVVVGALLLQMIFSLM